MNLQQLEGVALVTLTAPGTELGLAWDRTQCKHGDGVGCSGKLGCRVVKEVADRWNADCQARFSTLHRAAAQVARRLHGPGPIVAARTWEEQARGVQHVHIVVPLSTPREKARAKSYLAALKELAPRHWFGFADLRQRSDGEASGLRSALYLAKYVAKSAGAETAVKRPVLLGRFLTMASGLTMRLLRWRRYIWHVWGFRPSAEQLRPLVSFLQALRGLEDLARVGTRRRIPQVLALTTALHGKQRWVARYCVGDVGGERGEGEGGIRRAQPWRPGRLAGAV